MKSKTEFYKAYFETLEKKGFSIQPPSSPDYVADIYHRDRQIAFYAKHDAIIKNPFVEVDEKLIDKLQSLAKTTAIGCGICSDKPYDEAIAAKEQNGVVRINEHNGVVLACKHHPIFDYVLSTYRKDTENSNAAIQRQYFYTKETAFENFALRSGLVDEKKLFSETDLKILHAGLIKMRTIDKDLDQEDLNSVATLIDKIEDIVPELGKKERVFDFTKLFTQFENALER
ncbi:hypothetical protein [Lacrimispora brassicae]|jgi:hypothetical protein